MARNMGVVPILTVFVAHLLLLSDDGDCATAAGPNDREDVRSLVYLISVAGWLATGVCAGHCTCCSPASSQRWWGLRNCSGPKRSGGCQVLDVLDLRGGMARNMGVVPILT
eukprot:5384257-Amphidinium_carterae.1